MLKELDECREKNVVGENIGYLSTFVANVAVEMATHDCPKNADERRNVGCPKKPDVIETFSHPQNVDENEHYHPKSVV